MPPPQGGHIDARGILDVLPIAEIDFSAFEPGRPRVVDYAAKWDADSFEFQNTPRVIPARLSEQLADEIRRLARAAWDAVGCLDYARVDFRLTDEGVASRFSSGPSPVILEVNPNPDISPDAGFAAALTAANLSLAQFVHTVLSNAARRARIPLPHARPARTASGGCPPPRTASP